MSFNTNSKPVEPEAEPVAWINIDRGNITMDPYRAECWKGEGKNIEPLYLHPPRPEPEAEPVALVSVSTKGSCWGDYSDVNIKILDTNYLKPSPLPIPVYRCSSKATSLDSFLFELYDALQKAVDEAVADDLDEWYANAKKVLLKINGINQPRPEPARKPMTEEEMRKGSGEWAHLHNIFEEGIRFAEKHHGIGIDKSDPDSIDLQSRCRGDKL